MSDSGDIPQLDELEPLEEADSQSAPAGDAAAPTVAERTLNILSAGLPAPASNPRAEKEYYRFLFAGVVMFLGCMMPFGPEWTMAGYKTPGGALYTLIAVGMIWSWWTAIHRNRFTGANLKWVLLALVPLFLQLIDLIFAFEQPAVRDYVNQGKCVASWGELSDSILGMLRGSPEGLKAGNFFRAFGTGKVVLLLGALMAEVSFVMAIFSGAKAAKQQKQARHASASERRRR